LLRRHVDGADLCARRLVVCAQHRSAPPRHRRRERISGDHERFRHERADGARLTGPRNRQPFQRRMIADAVGRFSVRHLPDELAAIEIDRRDASVRRLQQRQTLRRRVRVDGAVVGRRRRAARPRAGRRVGAGVFTGPEM